MHETVMLHLISKLGWWLISPLNLGFVILLIALALLWTRRWRLGRALIGLLAASGVAISVLPLGDWAIRPLEDRFPAIASPMQRVDGIVVLGGVVDQFMTRARGQPSINGAVERLTEFMALAKRHPNARLVFSGGSGAVFDQSVKEATAVRQFIASQGMDVSRVQFESESRNTVENATLTKDLAQPKPGERWVLVTSALHMPRSMGAFRAAGWRIIPFPVDYLTSADYSPMDGVGFGRGLSALSTAMREWVALAVYRILGRTNSLFPAPRPNGVAGT